MKLLLVLLLTLALAETTSAAESCDIYIHGYTPDGTNYFGDLPRQVIWDANQEIEVSAPEVARKILAEIDTCPKDSSIVLRPHSYGAAQIHYILSKGFHFQETKSDHDYVRIYQLTDEVYAYTGAFHGTPLMDIVCANRITAAIAEKFGRSCVRTLTTSELKNVSGKAQTPGVPIHLITSSDRTGYYRTTGSVIAMHLVGFWDYIRGRRNQNDNTLPLYSTKACAHKQLLLKPYSTCEKLDTNYFIDFYHTDNQHHNEFLKDKDFMQMKRFYEE